VRSLCDKNSKGFEGSCGLWSGLRVTRQMGGSCLEPVFSPGKERSKEAKLLLSGRLQAGGTTSSGVIAPGAPQRAQLGKEAPGGDDRADSL
jgi:hypothetical protein